MQVVLQGVMWGRDWSDRRQKTGCLRGSGLMGEGRFFRIFSDEKETGMRKKSSLSEGLNRGLMRGFHAELGRVDDGRERWPR